MLLIFQKYEFMYAPKPVIYVKLMGTYAMFYTLNTIIFDGCYLQNFNEIFSFEFPCSKPFMKISLKFVSKNCVFR